MLDLEVIAGQAQATQAVGKPVATLPADHWQMPLFISDNKTTCISHAKGRTFDYFGENPD